jgi:hypothetical protein
MSNISNLRIKTELGDLIYRQVSDLNLSFSRIVDDFTDVSNRFGDFSYEFNLPIVKENSRIFGAPETIGSKGVFIKNRNILCQVYNNNQLILDGLINLESVTADTYKCKFFSKFKELIDTLNSKTSSGQDKTLRDLTSMLVPGWKYETSIISHILADYKNSDETFYQYPLSYYSTYYTEASIYSGLTDYQSYIFDSDRPRENYYYMMNNVTNDGEKKNHVYFHQIPPAIYIKSIIEQILDDAGWKLGGQFFNDPNIKKIILLYSGEDDIYDQAITGSTTFQGSSPVTLNMAKFLPDMGQAEFLTGIINLFNLYFRIDTNNKIIELETYDTYFRFTDLIDPYDITSKLDFSSVETGYFLNNNPSILFDKALNQNIFGDNRVMTGATDNAFTTPWLGVSNSRYNQTFNRVGFTEQSNVNLNNFVASVTKIEVPFSEPTIKRHFLWNDHDIFGVDQNAGVHNIYLPLLSKQTPADNNNMKFNKKDTDNYLFNDEPTIKFQGRGSLMYYYGVSHSDFENKSGKGVIPNYFYYNIWDHTGSTLYNMAIPIVNPFQISNNRTDIEDWLNNMTNEGLEDRRTPVATYLQALWQMLGSSTGITSGMTTEFSLTFDDGGYFHETLWTKFHKYKWDRYQNSEMITANININSYDWDQLQINRPIKYRGELYSLVSIQGYNPITQKAQISMIKKL